MPARPCAPLCWKAIFVIEIDEIYAYGYNMYIFMGKLSLSEPSGFADHIFILME